MTDTEPEINTNRGLFVVIDGPQASGKAIQCDLLRRYLEEKGHPVVNSPEGSFQYHSPSQDPITQILQEYAYRRTYLTGMVQPNLDSGITVITNRFEASTYAELGWSRDIDKAVYGGLSFELSRHVVQKCRPDVNIILDINPEKFVGKLDVHGRDINRLIEGYRYYGRGFFVGNSEYADTQVDFVNGMRPDAEVRQEIVGLVEQTLGKVRDGKLSGHPWIQSYRDRADLPNFSAVTT